MPRRPNIDRTSVNLSGRNATKLGGAPAGQVVGGPGEGQSAQPAPSVPQPVVNRPKPVTPGGPARAGSRVVTGADPIGAVRNTDLNGNG